MGLLTPKELGPAIKDAQNMIINVDALVTDLRLLIKKLGNIKSITVTINHNE